MTNCTTDLCRMMMEHAARQDMMANIWIGISVMAIAALAFRFWKSPR